MYRKYMTETQFERFKRDQLKDRYMDVKRVEELFPDIEHIVISYHLYHGSAFGVQNEDRVWTIKPDDQAVFVIDCLNRECTSSGFDLKNEIYSMRRDSLNEKSGEMSCNGQEAPDHPEQSCEGTLSYTIKITYKHK